MQQRYGIDNRINMNLCFVTDKPVIDLASSSKTVGSWDNNEIKLKCLASGLPPPNFQWFTPGDQLVTKGISNIHNGETLTVKTTAPGDYGKYKCLVTNVVGTADHTIIVEKWGELNKYMFLHNNSLEYSLLCHEIVYFNSFTISYIFLFILCHK